MPKYRAYRFRNVRESATQDFEAANDDAARHQLELLSEDAWLVDNIPVESGSVTDETLGLDELDEDGHVTGEPVIEEIAVHGEFPYGNPSRDLVERLAAIEDDEVNESSVLTLGRFIAEARKLCNGNGRDCTKAR